jgi:SAM-dependent methyltransferase
MASQWDSAHIRQAYNNQPIVHTPYQGFRKRKRQVDREEKDVKAPSGGNQVMRRIVNLLKRHLFETHLPIGATVLDLCAGKGQDLIKYAKRQVDHVVMFDQSPKQCEEAKIRFEEMKKDVRLAYKGMRCDIFVKDLTKAPHIQIKPRVQVASCQLALHYLWGSTEGKQGLKHILNESLAPGGVFLLTIIDSDRFPAEGFQLSRPNLSYGSPFVLSSSSTTGNLWAYNFRFPGVVDSVREAVIAPHDLLEFCFQSQLVLIDKFHYSDKKNVLIQMDRTLQDLPETSLDVKAISLYQSMAFQHVSSDDPRLIMIDAIRQMMKQVCVNYGGTNPITRHSFKHSFFPWITVAWTIVSYLLE